jgi:hypothetical protein
VAAHPLGRGLFIANSLLTKLLEICQSYANPLALRLLDTSQARIPIRLESAGGGFFVGLKKVEAVAG